MLVVILWYGLTVTSPGIENHGLSPVHRTGLAQIPDSAPWRLTKSNSYLMIRTSLKKAFTGSHVALNPNLNSVADCLGTQAVPCNTFHQNIIPDKTETRLQLIHSSHWRQTMIWYSFYRKINVRNRVSPFAFGQWEPIECNRAAFTNIVALHHIVTPWRFTH